MTVRSLKRDASNPDVTEVAAAAKERAQLWKIVNISVEVSHNRLGSLGHGVQLEDQGVEDLVGVVGGLLADGPARVPIDIPDDRVDVVPQR